MAILEAPQFDGKAVKRTHVMAKPIGAACNLDCDYCYYLSKEDLLEYKKGVSPSMNDETLEHFIKSYIENQNTPEIVFTWQGGEPTMLGIDYFEKVIALQKRYQPEGVMISNDLQTNGVRLNEKWMAFLKKNNFLVGLSIDGDELDHNTYRTSKSGRGTHKQVMNAVRLLHEFGIPFNALCVVNNVNSLTPLQTYRFLRDVVNPQQIQFTPLVERKDFRTTAPYQGVEVLGSERLEPSHPESVVEAWSVSPEQWGSFLISVFDEWYANDIGEVFVNYFESAFQTWQGLQSDMCTLSEVCGKGLAIEPNGDLFVCDHYVYPEHKVGNIVTDDFNSIAYGSKQQSFGYAKSKTLNKQCESCTYKFACYGECPRNRFTATKEGELGLNYFCAGWKRFFKHIDKPLSELIKVNNLVVVNGKNTENTFNLEFKF